MPLRADFFFAVFLEAFFFVAFLVLPNFFATLTFIFLTRFFADFFAMSAALSTTASMSWSETFELSMEASSKGITISDSRDKSSARRLDATMPPGPERDPLGSQESYLPRILQTN